MKIAILSDIHDNIWKLEEVLEGLGEAQELIFCGDFCAPFSLGMLAEGFRGPIHVVFGNNDGDKLLLSQVAAKAGNVTLHANSPNWSWEGGRSPPSTIRPSPPAWPPRAATTWSAAATATSTRPSGWGEPCC